MVIEQDIEVFERIDKRLHELLIKRYNNAKGLADLWASILEACFFYAIPYRNQFYYPKETEGGVKNSRLYDTTAVEATKTFVSKLHNTMTPPQVQWGFLLPDDSWENEDPKKYNEAALILQNYTRRVFNYIFKSNFDVVINECYLDLAIGTSSLVINQGTDENPFLCTSIPIDKLAIAEAANGKIESWYRTWEDLKIVELSTRWKNITLSPTMLSDIYSDPDAKVQKIYEGVSFFPGLKKPYCYAVWTSEQILLKEYLESNPGIVWRFQKTNNETWGRGPVMDALPSIQSLNEMGYIEFASANLNVFKPYMGFSDAVFNPHTFVLKPFSIIPIAPLGTGGSPPLIPLPDSSNPQFAQLTIMDLRMQIKTLLFADTPQDSMSVQPQTAYELSLKQQSLAEKIGPLFSRLQQEFLAPIFERCCYILDKMGLLPKPVIQNEDGTVVPIKFQYRSPLALAKGQQEIARLTQFIQLMQGIWGPESTTIYLNPKTGPYLLQESLQLDPRYLNTPDEVAKVLQNLQNQQNQAQMLNQPEQVNQPAPEGAAMQPLT